MDPYDSVRGFLDWSRYFFFQVAPQLYSRDRVAPLPDLLLLRKSVVPGIEPRTSGSVARNSDHKTAKAQKTTISMFTGVRYSDLI
jgi:hypothetical protein